MGMTLDDYAQEQAFEEMHHEEVMRRATISQCIYVFVEGESEELAIPLLLERYGVDFENQGIVIANYNGINNLPNVLRLMNKTLSYDRPIIITYDDDLDGQRIERKISSYIQSNEKISFQRIPALPVVSFKNGRKGGSFEESFKSSHFIDTCFNKNFMPSRIASKKSLFLKEFKESEPWLSQICQFCKRHDHVNFGGCKVQLAEALANTCEQIPSTFCNLGELVIRVRKNNPIKHPDDIELQNVHGLTC